MPRSRTGVPTCSIITRGLLISALHTSEPRLPRTLNCIQPVVGVNPLFSFPYLRDERQGFFKGVPIEVRLLCGILHVYDVQKLEGVHGGIAANRAVLAN